jgi:hypothetical protein
MRQAFVQVAVLLMEPHADMRAPGAAVTVALCGHWEHELPCPLAPHHVSADGNDGELRVRILFAAEPDKEGEVRHLIEQAQPGTTVNASISDKTVFPFTADLLTSVSQG